MRRGTAPGTPDRRFPHDLAANLTEVWPRVGLKVQTVGTTGPLGTSSTPPTIVRSKKSLAGGSSWRSFRPTSRGSASLRSPSWRSWPSPPATAPRPRPRRPPSTWPRPARRSSGHDDPPPRPRPQGALHRSDVGGVRPRLPHVLHPLPWRYRVRVLVQRHPRGQLRLAERGACRGRGGRGPGRRLRDPSGHRGGRCRSGEPREHREGRDLPREVQWR